MMNIKKFTIIQRRHGVDTIYLDSDLPDYVLSLVMTTNNRMGEYVIKKYFPEVPYEIVKVKGE